MNVAHWPYGQPEREQELLREALATCQTQDQAEKVLGGFLLLDIITSIVTSSPAWREHWWQFWRLRRPR